MHHYTNYFSHINNFLVHSFIEVFDYCGKAQSVFPQLQKDSTINMMMEFELRPLQFSPHISNILKLIQKRNCT